MAPFDVLPDDKEEYTYLKSVYVMPDGVTAITRRDRLIGANAVDRLIKLYNRLHPEKEPVVKLCCEPDVHLLLRGIHSKLYPNG